MTSVKRLDKENLVSTCGPSFKPGHEEITRTPLSLLKDVRNRHTKPNSVLKTHENIPLKRTFKTSTKKNKSTKPHSEMHKIQENIRLDPSSSLFKQFEYPEVENTPHDEPEPQDKLFPSEELQFINELVKINIASPHHSRKEHFKLETPVPIEERCELLEVELTLPEDLPLPDELIGFELEQMLEACHI
ncbi:hypothetical protein LOD99_2325 [Oopsacas minuta]|uniref:Securin n=1 Tax=Oopsacas minuta TaxID=111878 RepID=A0AAV7K2B2_9METZ|nr:hypothetical protein LOD99_2325 [Oopsacas minuta]